MGGAVSAGEDNEELVDNLVESDYLKTPTIEIALRAVDRGSYYLDGHQDTAYKDLAWKHGRLHISAPCIYSEVLECLDVEPGMSFLNLGSGTGYLSTVIGLLLGAHGINHGVELHESVVDYARMKLDEFVAQSSAIDMLDFSAPEFVVGNCLQLDPSTSFKLYDRVYCGAAVPEEQQAFFRSFLKVGGVAVMPCGDQLQKVRRVGENEFEEKSVLPVSFAVMVLPTDAERAQGTNIKLPDREPMSLQNLCRIMIRQRLRLATFEEYPEAQMSSLLQAKNSKSLDENQTKCSGKRRRRRIRRIVIPVFNTDSEDDEEENGLRQHVRRHIMAIRSSGYARAPNGSIRFEDLRFNREVEPMDEDAEEQVSDDSEMPELLGEEDMMGSLAAEAPVNADMPSQDQSRDTLEEENEQIPTGSGGGRGLEITESIKDFTDSSPNGSKFYGDESAVQDLENDKSYIVDHDYVSNGGGYKLPEAGSSSKDPVVRYDEAEELSDSCETPMPLIVRKSVVGEPPISGEKSEDGDSDGQTEYNKMKEERKTERDGLIERQRNFSENMKRKIDNLPLPEKLKDFVNYFR